MYYKKWIGLLMLTFSQKAGTIKSRDFSRGGQKNAIIILLRIKALTYYQLTSLFTKRKKSLKSLNTLNYGTTKKDDTVP